MSMQGDLEAAVGKALISAESPTKEAPKAEVSAAEPGLPQAVMPTVKEPEKKTATISTR